MFSILSADNVVIWRLTMLRRWFLYAVRLVEAECYVTVMFKYEGTRYNY